MELVDVTDSKSVDGNIVWVRVPPPAPKLPKLMASGVFLLSRFRARVYSGYEEGMEKKLLRDACKELLPPQLLYRKKSPYPKTYSPVYEALLVERFQKILANAKAPVHRFLDRKKAERFLMQPKDYGKPWFGQLMAGPQMIAYFLQINYWMERYGIE